VSVSLGIAGERIWVELKKILKGKYADHLVKIMSECGVTQHIGMFMSHRQMIFNFLCTSKVFRFKLL